PNFYQFQSEYEKSPNRIFILMSLALAGQSPMGEKNFHFRVSGATLEGHLNDNPDHFAERETACKGNK
ncbi:hypothetical protein, partial [Iodidimonas nitroreducens]|uniref:hypothetical protein n=1 Tax=Iodidimonas nitroreducens TaxID=1236968 RepID=UPI0028D28275